MTSQGKRNNKNKASKMLSTLTLTKRLRRYLRRNRLWQPKFYSVVLTIEKRLQLRRSLTHQSILSLKNQKWSRKKKVRNCRQAHQSKPPRHPFSSSAHLEHRRVKKP